MSWLEPDHVPIVSYICLPDAGYWSLKLISPSSYMSFEPQTKETLNTILQNQ